MTQAITQHIPFLRRYARALSGSQSAGDSYVVMVLETLVSDPSALGGDLSPRVALYRLFSRVWNALPINQTVAPGDESVESRLEAVTPRARQAFLLSAMEGFESDQIGDILDEPKGRIGALLEQANAEIARQIATDVLIIEDEPLIALELEALMESLGHRVRGIATTHAEALKVAGANPIGLILADIQLADGSSGLDAVNELLDRLEAPVIFITAYPERLLTGARPEPTYLISKPYERAEVAAVTSQALFFGEKAGKGTLGAAALTEREGAKRASAPAR